MPGEDLQENTSALLATVLLVNMETKASPNAILLWTPGTGKSAIIDKLEFYNASGTLDGCDDVNIGCGVAAITPVIIDAITTLTNLVTATTGRVVIHVPDGAEYALVDGDAAAVANKYLSILCIDGCDAAATVSIDIYGRVIDN